MASLARAGLELLKDASPKRQQGLEATASRTDFLAERLPQLFVEWNEYYEAI